MSMMLRRGMMVPKAPGGLPSEYLRVQYIQGTGTQYIVTNLTGNIDREWIFDISDFDKNGNSYAPLFGIAVVGSNLGVYLANIKIYTAFGNKGDITYNTTVSGWKDRFTLRQSKDGVYENDTHVLNAYSSLTYGSSDITMAFPGRNGPNGVERITKAKIYGFICKENGVVIADYVPCIRISDSKPGMYDLVGRQFYTNAGTGEFIAGHYVLPYPVGTNLYDNVVFTAGERLNNQGEIVEGIGNATCHEYFPVDPAYTYERKYRLYTCAMYDENLDYIGSVSANDLDASTVVLDSRTRYIRCTVHSNYIDNNGYVGVPNCYFKRIA